VRYAAIALAFDIGALLAVSGRGDTDRHDRPRGTTTRQEHGRHPVRTCRRASSSTPSAALSLSAHRRVHSRDERSWLFTSAANNSACDCTTVGWSETARSVRSWRDREDRRAACALGRRGRGERTLGASTRTRRPSADTARSLSAPRWTQWLRLGRRTGRRTGTRSAQLGRDPPISSPALHCHRCSHCHCHHLPRPLHGGQHRPPPPPHRKNLAWLPRTAIIRMLDILGVDISQLGIS
jgi:hypothetical protein